MQIRMLLFTCNDVRTEGVDKTEVELSDAGVAKEDNVVLAIPVGDVVHAVARLTETHHHLKLIH